MVVEKKYICSKEKYLGLKEIQKSISKISKEDKLEFKKYIKTRREFYHSKGMQIPNNYYDYNAGEYLDKRDGFDYPLKKSTLDVDEPRYVNIIYGLVKGTPYNKIEKKVRENNEPTFYFVQKYCSIYDIDFNTIKELIW